MLAGKRSVRVGDQILREVALILMERVKDPRVEGVTVTGINLSKDLRYAKIYYSVMGETSQVERARIGLDSAKGFIKREIGMRLTLRYVPEITFVYDSTLVTGSEIERLFEKLKSDGSIEAAE